MTVADIVIGEWVWAALKAVLSGSAILLIMYALGIVHGFRPLMVLPVLLLLGLCVAGLALIMTTIAKGFDFFAYYFTLVLTPMSFMSGIFFPFQALPAAMQKIALLMPLAHAAMLARGLVFGEFGSAGGLWDGWGACLDTDCQPPALSLNGQRGLKSNSDVRSPIAGLLIGR
jgi:lipooligosaccharide transport system permease protein